MREGGRGRERKAHKNGVGMSGGSERETERGGGAMLVTTRKGARSLMVAREKPPVGREKDRYPTQPGAREIDRYR